MSSAPNSLPAFRSLLFVPGDRPERFVKAGSCGADLACIDLEDAVAPAARAQARVAVLSFLQQQPTGHHYGLRISGLTTADGLRDLLALREACAAPAFVMLAKADNAEQIALLAAQLPGLPLIALIETSAGLQAAPRIACAHGQLQALMLGGADLAAELGCAFAWEPLLHARSVLVAAAAGAGRVAIDVPWLDVADAEGARQETQRVAALGFTAKALIHPSQVVPVHAGLMPSSADLARARRVVQACADGPAAALLDGILIDRPVLLSARRILLRAGE